MLVFVLRSEELSDSEVAAALEASDYGDEPLAREAARRLRGLPRKPGPKSTSKRKDTGALEKGERYSNLWFTYRSELERAERERVSDHAPRAVKEVARMRTAALHDVSGSTVSRAIRWIKAHSSAGDDE